MASVGPGPPAWHGCVSLRPDIVITDEAHRRGGLTWLRISEETERAVHIGVTATPCRMAGGA